MTAGSAAAPNGPLYAGKTASFSDSWAVEHGCPTNIVIDFTDSGPQLGESDDHSEDLPGLEWTPSCTGMNQQVDFDRDPVAKVSGSPSRSACQASAEQSLTDGTAVRAVAVADLSAGDEFCEYVRATGHVILMKVTNVSATAPIQHSTTGDLVYFPTCLGGPAKIRFGEPTAPVDGSVDTAACLDAAAASGDTSLDVEVPELRAGSTFCEYNNDIDAVILLKVFTVGDPVSITFSATAWQAPEQ